MFLSYFLVFAVNFMYSGYSFKTFIFFFLTINYNLSFVHLIYILRWDKIIFVNRKHVNFKLLKYRKWNNTEQNIDEVHES